MIATTLAGICAIPPTERRNQPCSRSAVLSHSRLAIALIATVRVAA